MAKLPPSASIAHVSHGAQMFAPSAERNKAVLVDLIRAHAPATGHALEIASGTGQHITAYASALPDLYWQPSEPDAARRASIDCYVAEAGLGNVAPATPLDIAQTGWAAAIPQYDLITCTNLTHLISTPATQSLITGVARCLAPHGRFLLYGPFKRSGVLTSEGDRRFDTELRTADAAIGYKDDLDILRWLGDAGLSHFETADMPANNLCIIAGHPDP